MSCVAATSPSVGHLGAADSVFDVTAYGAKGDGVTYDTVAVRAAAAALAAASGGTLLFPSPGSAAVGSVSNVGMYLTGAFNLTSNSVLVIEPEATILGSQRGDGDDYPLIPPLPWYGCDRDCTDGPCRCDVMRQALIYSNDANNVTLTGGGTVNGQGTPWWVFARAGFVDPPCLNISRPHLVQLARGSDIVIRDLTFVNSSSWTLNPTFVSNLLITNNTISNPSDSHNTDGVDTDCVQDAVVSHNTISVGDDCLCVKSGIDWFGRTYGRPSQNILFDSNTLYAGHGAMTIGSETSGSVFNITFQNNVMKGTEVGPRVKTQRGRGGAIAGIYFLNNTGTQLGAMIQVTENYSQEPQGNASTTPSITNIVLQDLSFVDCKLTSLFDGLPESIMTNITLANVDFGGKVKFSPCDYVDNAVCLGDVSDCPPCFKKQ